MGQWKGIIAKGFTAAEFEDYVRTLRFDQWRPQFVVVHNTGDPTFAEWHSVPPEERLSGLQSYYRDDQEWSAGPHLFVADDKIWVFTPLTTPGVHSPSWNHVSWGVEIVGDYDREVFRSDVRANVISALTTLHEAIGLDPLTLKLHKEDPRTTHTYCPGSHISKNDIVSAIQHALFVETGEHLQDRAASSTTGTAPATPAATAPAATLGGAAAATPVAPT
jgi:hypothetical protein